MIIKVFDQTDIKKQHLDNITMIQTELAIYDQLKTNGIIEADNGLLISGYTYSDLVEGLKKGGQIYLSYDDSAINACGYLLSSTGKEFTKKLFSNETIVRWNEIDSEIMEKITKSQYTYLDQIGVQFIYHKSGVAYSLLEAYERYNKGSMTILLVMTNPINNIRSKSFFLKKSL